MTTQSETEALQQQLDSMRQLAMSIMTSQGDMGVVVQFLKDSFNIASYEELGRKLLESVQSLGLSGAVTIQTYTGRIFVGTSGSNDHSTAARLEANLLAGRIAEFDSSLQINFEKASMLVEGLPDNPERVGQLRDSLALLLEGAEARVKALISEEKAREARAARDEFFSMVSDELRTPLTPIISYATRLESKLGSDLDDQYRKVIRSIKSNGEGLLRLIDNVISLGRMETGEISVITREFNVADALRLAALKAEGFVNNDRVSITWNVDSGLTFVADPTRFIDILISLLAYCAQASDTHTIHIKAHRESTDTGSQLVVTLADDGTPITEAYRTRLFNTDNSTSNEELYESNDLGIGLYLTKKLVGLHGGTIELQQECDRGNRFALFFPAESPGQH